MGDYTTLATFGLGLTTIWRGLFVRTYDCFFDIMWKNLANGAAVCVVPKKLNRARVLREAPQLVQYRAPCTLADLRGPTRCEWSPPPSAPYLVVKRDCEISFSVSAKPIGPG